MTQTHLVIAAALFARPGKPRRNAAALLGAIVPDLGIYGLWIWSKLAGVSEVTLWGEIYWKPQIREMTSAFHSIPVYGGLALLAWLLTRPITQVPVSGGFSIDPDNKGPKPIVRAGAARENWPLAIFALAGLTHASGDFFVHVADAHAQFWPFSQWRFVSPVSYWDPAHYGTQFSIFEACIGVVLTLLLIRRFRSLIIRLLLLVLLAAYVAVPAYFQLMHHG
jgi:hypothetical protein